MDKCFSPETTYLSRDDDEENSLEVNQKCNVTPRQQDRQFITQHVLTEDGNPRYALKIITPSIVQSDFRKFLQAAMDLTTEVYFLSVLDHPHIIKLRGVGRGDFFSPNFFLVLDRLQETLQDRVEETWRQQLDNLENNFLVWNR